MSDTKADVKKPKHIGYGQREHYKKLRRLVKKYLHLRRNDEWKLGVHLCTVVAWTGALVVTAVVLRSLYLMYIKPDTT